MATALDVRSITALAAPLRLTRKAHGNLSWKRAAFVSTSKWQGPHCINRQRRLHLSDTISKQIRLRAPVARHPLMGKNFRHRQGRRDSLKDYLQPRMHGETVVASASSSSLSKVPIPFLHKPEQPKGSQTNLQEFSTSPLVLGATAIASAAFMQVAGRLGHVPGPDILFREIGKRMEDPVQVMSSIFLPARVQDDHVKEPPLQEKEVNSALSVNIKSRGCKTRTSSTEALMKLCEENRRLQSERETTTQQLAALKQDLANIHAAFDEQKASVSLSPQKSLSMSSERIISSNIFHGPRKQRSSGEIPLKINSMLQDLSRTRKAAEARAQALQNNLTGALTAAVEKSLASNRVANRHETSSKATHLLDGLKSTVATLAAAASVGSSLENSKEFSSNRRVIDPSMIKSQADARSAATKLASLEDRLDAVTAALKESQAVREQRCKSHQELLSRVEAVLKQKPVLTHSVVTVERKAPEQGTAWFLPSSGLDSNKVQGPSFFQASMSPLQLKLAQQLDDAKANYTRYVEAVHWTKQQLATSTALDKKALEDSLQFAEQRAKEEAERISILQSQLAETRPKAVGSNTLVEELKCLQNQLPEFSQSEHSNNAKVSATSANGDCCIPCGKPESIKTPQSRAQQFAPSSGSLPSKSSRNASSCGSTSKSASGSKRAKQSKAIFATKMKDGRVCTASVAALKQYGRAVWSAFIDQSLSIQEQRVGASLLVEELVAMGGSMAWAQQFVNDGLAVRKSTCRVVENVLVVNVSEPSESSSMHLACSM